MQLRVLLVVLQPRIGFQVGQAVPHQIDQVRGDHFLPGLPRIKPPLRRHRYRTDQRLLLLIGETGQGVVYAVVAIAQECATRDDPWDALTCFLDRAVGLYESDRALKEIIFSEWEKPAF